MSRLNIHHFSIIGKIDMIDNNFIADEKSNILITGASGFVGARVLNCLLDLGFENICCMARPSGDISRINEVIEKHPNALVKIFRGNLLSREDCFKLANNTQIIFHLAAGIDKSFPGAFMNSVVTTRNLLDEIINSDNFKRFVNVSSFAVYSNLKKPRHSFLDETCDIDLHPELRFEAYTYGKLKQEQLVREYSKRHSLPFVNVRPGVVYGPGKRFIPSRVGIDTFGIFLHLGGNNELPLTYVDNCAEAIVLAGLVKNIEGENFNIVDDDLPSSKEFLDLYKKNVKNFCSIRIPYPVFYIFSFLWETYSKWSNYQLPPVFTRRRCSVYWKGNHYSNAKLKEYIGWSPKKCLKHSLENYFSYQRKEINA
jgi:nucleoside-diphosphate-sugar epimerase